MARGVQGVAAATVNVTSLALVSAAFPDPKAKARAIGIWAAIAGVANAVGPTVGGVLVETIGWRSIFWVNVPVGVVVTLLTLRYVDESRDDHPRTLDLVGQGLFMAMVGAFAFAVIEGPKRGWTAPTILALFALAAIALAAFVAYEKRTADPMMDLNLFRDPTYAMAIATICVALFTLYGMLLVTTQYLQNVRGFSPVDAGLFLLPFSIAMLVGSPLAGHLVGKIGAVVPIRFGLAIMMAGLAVLIAGTARHPLFVIAGLALLGFGYALCLTPTTSLAMTSVPPKRAGMASGIMSAQRAIGSTLGFAVMGSVLAAWIVRHARRRSRASGTRRARTPQSVARGHRRERQSARQRRRNRAGTADSPRGSRHGSARFSPSRSMISCKGFALRSASPSFLLGAVLVAGLIWFPRGSGAAMADAQQEAKRVDEP